MPEITCPPEPLEGAEFVFQITMLKQNDKTSFCVGFAWQISEHPKGPIAGTYGS